MILDLIHVCVCVNCYAESGMNYKGYIIFDHTEAMPRSCLNTKAVQAPIS